MQWMGEKFTDNSWVASFPGDKGRIKFIFKANISKMFFLYSTHLLTVNL